MVKSSLQKHRGYISLTEINRLILDLVESSMDQFGNQGIH